MLFALDIDGTIGQDTNRIARILVRDFCMPIPEKALDRVDSLSTFLHLRPVQAYLNSLSSEQHDHFREALKAASKHPDVQRNRIPLPGAVEALQELAQNGAKIIYTTCRQPESEQLTRDWLARYGFPSPDQAYCCQHYHYKLLKAHDLAAPDERIIVIDDLVKEIMTGFIALYQRYNETARRLAPRLAVVAFACEHLPPFPVKIPFPIVTLKSWQPKDRAKLQRGPSALVN